MIGSSLAVARLNDVAAAIEQFKAAMRAVGLEPPGVIEPGNLHRYSTNGKASDDAGWCKLFTDLRGGVFGDHRTGLSEHWQAKTDRVMTASEREAFQRMVADYKLQAELEGCKRHEAAALKAVAILEAATGDPETHPYAVKKRVPLGSLVKRGPWPQRGWEDALLVPIHGADGRVQSIEAINTDGKKDSLKHGKKRGGFYPIRKICGASRVFIAEGIANAAVGTEVDKSPAVAAMGKSNLPHVALAVRELAAPGADIIILADNDLKLPKEAHEAAVAVGGRVVIPELDGRECDLWDVWNEHGIDAVERAIANAQAPVVGEHQPGTENATAGAGEGSDWPEPEPLIVQRDAEPYPVDALPGGIGAAVREVVGFAQCPVSLAACSALAALSAVGQGLADVRRAEKLVGPSSLFLLAIADSGERKTTCDGYFLSAIREWETQQAEAAKPCLAKHAAATQAWAAKREGVLTAIKGLAKAGKSCGEREAELERLEKEKPELLRLPRLLHGDSTPEALAWNLSCGWPSGSVLSSEAGIVFGGHGMGRDSVMRNMALLNILWDGGTLKVDRRTQESFTVRGARLTMGLAVQPDTVRVFFDSSKGLARGSGFAARFLIAWPESTQGERLFKDAPKTWPHLSAFHRRIGSLLDQAPNLNEHGDLDPPILDLSPEAKKVWVAFHDEVERELRPGGDMAETRDVASKAADNAVRLAALFNLYENDAGSAINAGHMKAAARIVAWHLYEARRFLGELALPKALSTAANLDVWLLRYCREYRTASISTRDVQRRGPNALRDKRALEEAITTLAEAGRVRPVQEGRRKRIEINPALLGGDHGVA